MVGHTVNHMAGQMMGRMMGVGHKVVLTVGHRLGTQWAAQSGSWASTCLCLTWEGALTSNAALLLAGAGLQGQW